MAGLLEGLFGNEPGKKANRGYTDIIIIHGIHYPRFSVEKCYILS